MATMHFMSENKHTPGEVHPAITEKLQYFTYSHLPPHLQAISAPFAELAGLMISQGLDGPQMTTGLQKLIEAKDCMVRAALNRPDQVQAGREDALGDEAT